MDEHPVRLVVDDDLERNRLTVFFRLILAIPHLIWVTLWTIAVVVVAICNWVTTLVAGRPPRPLHRFLCSYTRYTVQLSAYLHLVVNPYPPFLGETGEYEVDLRLPDPAAQPRWKTLIRIVLALPALLLSSVLGGAGGPVLNARGNAALRSYSSGGGALSGFCAFLGWFASVVTGRMPRGLRDAAASR